RGGGVAGRGPRSPAGGGVLGRLRRSVVRGARCRGVVRGVRCRGVVRRADERGQPATIETGHGGHLLARLGRDRLVDGDTEEVGSRVVVWGGRGGGVRTALRPALCRGGAGRGVPVAHRRRPPAAQAGGLRAEGGTVVVEEHGGTERDGEAARAQVGGRGGFVGEDDDRRGGEEGPARLQRQRPVGTGQDGDAVGGLLHPAPLRCRGR